MRAAVLSALMFAAQAQGAVIGVVHLRNGATLRLHDTAGICVNGALQAEYIAPGQPTIAGCWAMRGVAVSVAFLDGDSGEIPVQMIQKPTES